ncbi:MAG: hypothetical protein ACJATA_001685 [Sphingobacteriales bacterium]|jgi:hypothetical protein
MKMIRKNSYAFVLLNYGLPGIDGFTAGRYINSNPEVFGNNQFVGISGSYFSASFKHSL